MEMDVLDGTRVPSVDAPLGLAVLGGGTDEVDRDVVGGDETGEVKELVDVALSWKRNHHHHHLRCCLVFHFGETRKELDYNKKLARGLVFVLRCVLVFIR